MKMGGMEILVPRLARGMGTGRRLRHERTVHGGSDARSEHGVTSAAATATGSSRGPGAQRPRRKPQPPQRPPSWTSWSDGH